MKRIIASPATGKSAELLRLALENHGDIVVFNSNTVEVFVALAREVFDIPPEEISRADGRATIKDVTVASVLEYANPNRTRGFNRARPLYIDEISLCMKSLLIPFQVGGYTESIE